MKQNETQRNPLEISSAEAGGVDFFGQGMPSREIWRKSQVTQSPNIWAIYNDLSRRERSPQMVVKSKGIRSPQNGLKLSQGFIINCPETLQVPKNGGILKPIQAV